MVGDGSLQWRYESCAALNLVSVAVCDRPSTTLGAADAAALDEFRLAARELVIAVADDEADMEAELHLGPDCRPVMGAVP